MRGLPPNKKSIPLHYYRSNETNFGDMLNENLMDFLGIAYHHSPAYFADLFAIGSILDDALLTPKVFQRKRPLHVYGSGFISPPTREDEQFMRPLIIHALRGKLSRERCERIMGKDLSSIPLGDPGLLVNRMFPTSHITKKYDVGLICHYVDDPAQLSASIQLKKMSYTKLDITSAPEYFVSRLAECRFVLSSAMHGLIAADSLGIPNAHIILGNTLKGGTYKFQDYYSAYNSIPYSPILASQKILGDHDIDRLKSQYKITQEEVHSICEKLLEASAQLNVPS